MPSRLAMAAGPSRSSSRSRRTWRWCKIAVLGLGRGDGGGKRAAPSFAGCPMPYKYNEPRRHKIPRARYRIQNWPEYDRALQRRGDLTVWVTPEAIAAWCPPRGGRRGRPRDYSDVAIETGHLLRLAFGRPWRQTEGLLRSIAALLGLELGIPDHTTFSRRSPGLVLATVPIGARRLKFGTSSCAPAYSGQLSLRNAVPW